MSRCNSGGEQPMSGSNHAVRRSYFSDDSRELACGALVDEVLEQVAGDDGERLNDHQQNCKYFFYCLLW